jgi:Spy/CpxP family protein refolding chaperone
VNVAGQPDAGEIEGRDVMKRTLLVGAVVLALAVPALAQQGQGRGPRPEIPMAGQQAVELDGSRAREVVIRFLELTPEQVAAWDTLLEARTAAVEPLREELQAVEEQLRELLQSENPDPAAIGTLVLQGKALREQIAAANQAYVEGFEAMLERPQLDRLEFLRRAERAEPLFPAFRLFGLLPLEFGGPGPGPLR